MDDVAQGLYTDTNIETLLDRYYFLSALCINSYISHSKLLRW